MKITTKNIQDKINLKNIFKKIAYFINAKESLAVFLIFLIFIAYTGYLWYRYAYSYQWSDSKKQEYMNTKSAANSFNKAKFEKVLGDINSRQEAYQKKIDTPKDIFKLEQ